VFDGHNGVSAAVFSKEHLLEHVMSALPPEIGSREDWLQALPRALVAGFVKADIDFQRKGETDRGKWRLQSTPIELVAKYRWLVYSGEVSGTTATLVVVDGFTVTVASVGDSRCILDTQGGELQLLTVDHRLEENVEERERVTASGGEVGRLNLFGGQEVESELFLQKKNAL
jgi:serine/threonine protein phosphatase PrpC